MAKQKLSEFNQHSIDELKELGGVVVPTLKPDVDNYIVDINEFATQSDIDAEKERAINADNELKAEIENVKSELTTQINNEVERATSAEGALSEKITEVTNTINNEIERATTAETALSERITEVTNTINNEIERATTAESIIENKVTELNTVINNEIERATTAEDILSEKITEINNTINNEIERATTAETIIDNRITEVSGNLYDTILSGDVNLQIDINNIVSELQDSKNLSAGPGVGIVETDDVIVISAQGERYTPGDNIGISEDSVISVIDTENLYFDDSIKTEEFEDGILIGANTEEIYVDETMRAKILDNGIILGVNTASVVANIKPESENITIKHKSDSITIDTDNKKILSDINVTGPITKSITENEVTIGFNDAPVDDKFYVRNNANWVEQAPPDLSQYMKKTDAPNISASNGIITSNEYIDISQVASIISDGTVYVEHPQNNFSWCNYTYVDGIRIPFDLKITTKSALSNYTNLDITIDHSEADSSGYHSFKRTVNLLDLSVGDMVAVWSMYTTISVKEIGNNYIILTGNNYGPSGYIYSISISPAESGVKTVFKLNIGDTCSAGTYGFVEGYETFAANTAHAEGAYTKAYGYYSHAEGSYTTANNNAAHAEGAYTKAYGNYSHAEGAETSAAGYVSHAEGNITSAAGYASHAEGNKTYAYGTNSHAEGTATSAYGDHSHAEGSKTSAYGLYSHAEGYSAITNGEASHAEGYTTHATGHNSHAEGYQSSAAGYASHAENYQTSAQGNYSHAEGYITSAYGQGSHAEGERTYAYGSDAHAEGYYTTAYGCGHSEGYLTYATNTAHAEGYYAKAYGYYSHAEGSYTTANNEAAHAEGRNTYAANTAHAEGYYTKAYGYYSHAEGSYTTANTYYTHAEGYCTYANATATHTEGYYTSAYGNYSHAAGYYTRATHSAETVVGAYNLTSRNDSPLFVVGNGTSNSNRKDAFVVLSNGTVSASAFFDENGRIGAGGGGGSVTPGIGLKSVNGILSINTNGSANSAYSAFVVGTDTLATGRYSFAEGYGTSATGYYSHAAGYQSLAGANYAWADGYRTSAYGQESHAAGYETFARGYCSRTDGYRTSALDYESYAGGYYSLAYGECSFAFGSYVSALSYYSVAFGYNTRTVNECQFVIGKNNVGNTDSLFEIGNGRYDDERSNAFRVDTAGNVYAKSFNEESDTKVINCDTIINGDLIVNGRIICESISTFDDLPSMTCKIRAVSLDNLETFNALTAVSDVKAFNDYGTFVGNTVYLTNKLPFTATVNGVEYESSVGAFLGEISTNLITITIEDDTDTLNIAVNRILATNSVNIPNYNVTYDLPVVMLMYNEDNPNFYIVDDLYLADIKANETKSDFKLPFVVSYNSLMDGTPTYIRLNSFDGMKYVQDMSCLTCIREGTDCMPANIVVTLPENDNTYSELKNVTNMDYFMAMTNVAENPLPLYNYLTAKTIKVKSHEYTFASEKLLNRDQIKTSWGGLLDYGTPDDTYTMELNDIGYISKENPYIVVYNDTEYQSKDMTALDPELGQLVYIVYGTSTFCDRYKAEIEQLSIMYGLDVLVAVNDDNEDDLELPIYFN